MPGYTAECMTGQHQACTDRDCRCGCHAHVKTMLEKSASPPPRSGFPFICPACSMPGKIGDHFCRQDGVQLVQGKICKCGAAAEPRDVYCGICGQRFGEPAVKIPDLSEEEMKALEARARTRPSDVEHPPTTEVH